MIFFMRMQCSSFICCKQSPVKNQLLRQRNNGDNSLAAEASGNNGHKHQFTV